MLRATCMACYIALDLKRMQLLCSEGTGLSANARFSGYVHETEANSIDTATCTVTKRSQVGLQHSGLIPNIELLRQALPIGMSATYGTEWQLCHTATVCRPSLPPEDCPSCAAVYTKARVIVLNQL